MFPVLFHGCSHAVPSQSLYLQGVPGIPYVSSSLYQHWLRCKTPRKIGTLGTLGTALYHRRFAVVVTREQIGSGSGNPYFKRDFPTSSFEVCLEIIRPDSQTEFVR